MAQDVAFACTCGGVAGLLHGVGPGAGCHLVCYCADCRAFAHHLGVADRLQPGGGSALFQVLPARLEITRGGDRLACLRLSPRGLHRWYAACCNTPLANTVGTSRVPLAGMWRGLFADIAPLGPVTTHGFTRAARPGPGVPTRDKGLVRMFGGLLRRSLVAYVAGTARQGPFFDANGAPVVAPVVLNGAERKAAYSTG